MPPLASQVADLERQNEELKRQIRILTDVEPTQENGWRFVHLTLRGVFDEIVDVLERSGHLPELQPDQAGHDDVAIVAAIQEATNQATNQAAKRALCKGCQTLSVEKRQRLLEDIVEEMNTFLPEALRYYEYCLQLEEDGHPFHTMFSPAEFGTAYAASRE